MKPYILYELKLFVKNPKNKLMFLLFAAFLLMTSFFIFFRDVGNIEHTQYQEMNRNRIAISTLSSSIVEDPGESDFYDKLYDQQQLVALQDVAIRFEEDGWLVDAGLNLSQLQIDMHESHELENLDDEVRAIVPSLHQAETNQAFLTYINEESIPLLRNREHSVGFLLTFFEYFGTASFVFLLLFSCSIISTDLNHQSMVKGYPLSYEQKNGSKVAIYTIASFLTIILLTTAFAGLIGLFNAVGPLDYPLVMYQTNQYTAVSLLTYALRYSLYILVLSIHVSTLSALLNTLTRNMYATLFVGLFLYFIPLITQVETALWRWIPLQYYHVFNVISGEAAYLTGQSQLTHNYGIVVLLLWSAIFAGVIYGYEKVIRMKRGSKSKNLVEEPV